MKRALKDKFSIIFFCIALLIIVSSCNNASNNNLKESASKYTCPMHPQIVTSEPGTCPICHMDLVPVREHAGHDSIDASLENLIKPSNEIVLSLSTINHALTATSVFLFKLSPISTQSPLRSFTDTSSITNWGAIFAMLILSLVPTLALFIFFQRNITANKPTSASGIVSTGMDNTTHSKFARTGVDHRLKSSSQ